MFDLPARWVTLAPVPDPPARPYRPFQSGFPTWTTRSFLACDDLPAGAPRQVALGHSPFPFRHDDRDGEARRDHAVEPPVPGRAIKSGLSVKAALEGLQDDGHAEQRG